MFSFAARARAADPDNAAAASERLESLAASLRRVLREDGTLVVGTSYLGTSTELAAGALRARLESVLGSPEPDLLKIARMQARLGQRNAAADLLYLR
jgi:hypothetical protein